MEPARPRCYSQPMRKHRRSATRKEETAPVHGNHHPRGVGRGQIWSGTVSFGLVNIPVTLQPAERARELHFTMLDKRDLSPVGYRKINKNTGADVPRDEIIKGYQYGKDEYVTLTDADLKRASPERTQRIDILTFVDGSKIDPAHFERPYYLEPAAKADKAYVLLREALRRSGKVGIVTVVLRARQRLAALMVHGSALRLELLRYSHELRSPEELRLPGENLAAQKISEAELSMAERLIEELEGPWLPDHYKDEYHDELMAFIEAKAKAGKIEASPEHEKTRPAGPPADIMSLLKKSLASRERAGAGAHGARRHSH